MNNKGLHMLTFTLLVVGGLNWGLVGLMGVNLVDSLLGVGSLLAKIVYVLVGVSTVVVIATHKNDCRICGKGN